MAAFVNYSHIESIVDAVPLSSDTQTDVVSALGEAAVDGLLNTLNIEYSSSDRCYNFVYRYKTDSTESQVRVGDYLVRLSEGNYVVCDEEEFEQRYLPTYQDQDVMPPHPQTPKESLVTFIKKYYPDAGINSPADLTEDKLGTVAEGLKDWYNEDLDTFTVHYNHTGMIDPSGLADVFKAFPRASFIKDTTKFILDLSNGDVQEGDANTENNCFTYGALQTLVGEFKKMNKSVVKRVTSITFEGRSGAPSAVAPSVTDEQWNSFADEIMPLTGITARNQLKR